ncbi:alpha/beta-hydrolase [Laetiporus sulphureus 93-53]|uniref:Alpha/beta-hydrolase n=1 Tax=Laetiporus sulphureus 93-53 TaxID=1314785 RepID=A0A165EF66_9APHY|nr:alpha/beta-hydrolase [Laetiporus sulphureus 93-53]KZT06923.1 alpha/beta-hydrolase [Laetiporus sulphureus 93-53]
MAALSFVPFPVDHSMEALPVSSRIRTIYPEDYYPNGGYVQLPYGRTRYYLLGPEDGTKVALVHGLATPSVTYSRLGPYLASKGYRVLLYDLYGRGYSEAPKTPYTTNIFVVQLALLMQYLRWESAHIIGFSMGGGITAAFTATLPHLVSGNIVLIASAGVHNRDDEPPQDKPAVIPISQYAELINLHKELLPGYSNAVSSCLREGPIHELLWAFDKLGNTRVVSGEQVQVLLIHGTDDPLVRYADSIEIQKRIPTAQLVSISGGGHDVPVREEHWLQVAESTEKFFRA